MSRVPLPLSIARGFLPAALYSALTLLLVYPLLLHFGSAFPHDAGDPILNTWILWWNSQRIPFTEAWWSAPMFHPMPRALALSELLLGLLPITAPVQAISSPLVAYNVAFVLSFPLCGLAAYALALELTGRRDAAVLGGLAFAFAPYRMGQLSHLQVLSYYFTPLVFLALHRYQRSPRPVWLALMSVAWLFQSLTNGYALFHLGIFIALWVIWFFRPLRDAVPVIVSWAIGSLPLIPILLNYRSVHMALHLTRDVNEVRRFGADLGDFLTAPAEALVWGSRLWPARPETALFPGLTILVVGIVVFIASRRTMPQALTPTRDRQIWMTISALAGLVALSTMFVGPWRIGPLSVSDFHKPFSIAVGARLLASLRSPWMRERWRTRSVAGFYVIVVCAAYILALGPEPRVFGRPMLYEPPYAWLMRLPGFETLRVPARFAMLAVLGQSMLLAIAVARWSGGSRHRIVVVFVGLGILADGWVALPIAAAPRGGPTAWGRATVVAELPPGGNHDFDAMYRAMFHRLPIVNGYSSYNPPHYLPFVSAMQARQFEALPLVAGRGSIAVAVDLLAPDGPETAVALDDAGFSRLSAGQGWATFTIPAAQVPQPAVGDELSGIVVNADPRNQDVGAMTDHDVTTAWASGISQTGNESITIDLSSAHAVGAIVIDMGAYTFGFPRGLEVDVSADRSTWSTIWSGQTATLTVGAAIRDPGRVPLTIEIGAPTMTRHLRLRQTGAVAGIPWWVAGLHVHGPPTGR